MKVCVVGGGNIGTTMCCYMKHTLPNLEVVLYTRSPEKFNKVLICNDIENEITYKSELNLITNNVKDAVNNADVIYITVPALAVEKYFSEISPYCKPDVLVGIVPGYGGCEFFFHKYFPKSVALFGSQRVPFTARVEYGKVANLKSWKPSVVIGVLNKSYLKKVCDAVKITGFNPIPVDNYLAITLTPTNPLLHTARFYDELLEHNITDIFDRKIKVYVEWTDRASKVMMEMDNELRKLIDAIGDGYGLNSIKPLTVHYESDTVEKMTYKLSHIPAFQATCIPMKECSRGYIINTEARMFAEDFPWGLAIIKGFCEIYNIQTPYIDAVLKWYSSYVGVEYYYVGDNFTGKDLINTGIPQNFGIRTPKDVKAMYISS